MPHTQKDGLGLEDFYKELFTRDFFVFDESEPYFQEKLIQIAWNEQLLSDDLRLGDGRSLRVVHPGVWNLEAGPDFHDAALFIQDQATRGPVEVHLRPELWRSHGHQHDSAYAACVLHVVWENPKGHSSYPANTPLLVLKDHLSISLNELMRRFCPASYPYARQVQPSSWAERFAQLSNSQLIEMLQSYGVARALQRARMVGARIQQTGTDETAYQLICDAMGYKTNREAFAQLCEVLPLASFRDCDSRSAMSLLFGAAGLLPDPSRVPVLSEHRDIVSQLWSLWWSRRREYREIKWNRRQRPFNAPERRLLAVSVLLERCNSRPGSAIINSFAEASNGREALTRLRELLTIEDESWDSFYSFEKKLEKGGALLGKSRVDDLLVNVAVPFFMAWCFIQNNPEQCFKGRDALLEMALLQDNRPLKEAAGHFFVPPSRSREIVVNACSQQGLLKLYKDFLQGSE